jgi:hypothetical protein
MWLVFRISGTSCFQCLENFGTKKGALSPYFMLPIPNYHNRHQIINPYHVAFESKVDSESELGSPGHRYLFQCYTYQHHLIQLASIIIEMVRCTLKFFIVTE